MPPARASHSLTTAAAPESDTSTAAAPAAEGRAAPPRHAAARGPAVVVLAGAVAGIVFGGLASARPARAQGAAPDSGTLVRHEVEELEFIGGGTPLSPDERRRAADAIALALRIDAATLRANDRTWGPALARAARDPGYAAALREGSRYAYEFRRFSHPPFAPVTDIERAIVVAHDPAVAVDGARGQLVTEQTLRVLAAGAAEGARVLRVPAPGPDLVDRLRETLRGGFGALEARAADAVSHAGANLAYVPRGAGLFARYRGAFASPDPATQVKLAEAVSAMAATEHKLVDPPWNATFRKAMGAQNRALVEGTANAAMRDAARMMGH